MEITIETTGLVDDEATPPQKNDDNNSQSQHDEQAQIEKGSGYGPPKEGSGIMVPANDEEKDTEKADRDANSLHANDE
jgi:hypothetical protein